MWIAENLLCNVQQIGKNTGAKSCKLVQSEHPPNVSQGLTLYLKPVRLNCNTTRFEGWAEVSTHSQYFLEIQWQPSEWIEKNEVITSMSFIYALKKERKPAIFIVSLVRQKPLWRRKCWALLTERSSKVSGFSKHLRRRASYLSPAVTFRERGSKAAGFCLD